MQLQNNTILVTGGTSGFGFEYASKLIALGNTVIITGRNAQRLQEAKQKLPALHTIQSDASKPEEIIAFYERLQSISGPQHPHQQRWRDAKNQPARRARPKRPHARN